MRRQSAQDFAVIHQHVVRAKADNLLKEDSQGFIHVLLETLFELQDDEADDAVTDDSYRVAKGASPGKDRGVDAVHINEGVSPPAIHFFNCKYTSDIQKSASFFPSNELDKILTFLAQLMAKDQTLLHDINVALRAKVVEIWDQIDKTNPRFVAHFASNYTEGFTNEEQQRLLTALKVYNNFTSETHTQQSVANKLAHRVSRESGVSPHFLHFLTWTRRRKGDRHKVALARRLRAETTMSLAWVAERLRMGSWSYVSNLLRTTKSANSED